MQAQFLADIYRTGEDFFDHIGVRNWNITVTYWASDTASHSAIAHKYGITRARVRDIIVSTMSKLRNRSSIEIQNEYPLERLIRSKH